MKDIPTFIDENRRFFQHIYDETFDRYRVDWSELQKRVELAEAKATAAQLTVDAVLATLRAMGPK